MRGSLLEIAALVYATLLAVFFIGGCEKHGKNEPYPSIRTKGDYVFNVSFPSYRMGYRFGAYMDSPLPGEISERRKEVRDGMAE